MSFLSRKPARPEGRGRADQYDDYDDYAHDGYQSEDDGWSPNEYFSPEGIKGKWAGEQPDGRSGGRGGRTDNGRGDAGYDSYGNDFSGAEYGGQGYGADEIATGLYDLPDGADEDRGDRSRRRRSRDREDRGERTGILRLRRDRGEDIWPDDGISDEDYWASVAADRPLNGTDTPPDNVPPAGGASLRPGPDSRPGVDARPGMSGPDSRFGGDQRGGERGGTGRLGPPPGLAADYQPGSGALGGPSQPGGTSRTGSGPMPARAGTGPHPVRPGTGPTPTVGVTSSRPLAAPTGMRPGPAQPGPGASGSPQSAPRPSFQPTNGYQPGAAPSASRPQDRSDWGDRTERIERVNAAGYPEPRPASRSQGHGQAAGRGASGPLGLGTGAPATQGRGRNDGGAWRAPERQVPDRQAPERPAADRWEPGRDSGRETSGSWPAPVPPRGGPAARTGTGTDDDPLTSKAYSRAATTETDGRSYRAAARRSQAQTMLTDQAAETFTSGQYQQPAQHQAGRSGEYWQYRDDAQPSAGPGRYPAPGSQGPGGSQGGHQAQPGRGPAGPGQGPGHGGQPSQSGRNPGRPGLPGAGSGLPGGQYEAQQPRPSQQQRQQPQRQPGQQQVPTAGLPTAGSASGGPAAAGPGGGRAAGTGGLNPYDTTVSGSYPYPGQSYPARSAPANPAQDSTDDQYYRPPAPDGHGTGSASQGRTDQSRGGYGNGYPASGDRRH
jgi:hypothetical protein